MTKSVTTTTKSTPNNEPAKSAGKEANMTKTAEKPVAEKPVREKPQPQPCLCGCGDLPFNPTSRFVPGHDARLKGRIIANLKAQANGKTDKIVPVTDEQMAYAQSKWDHLIDFSGEKYKKVAKVAEPKAGAVPDAAKVKKA